MSSTRTRAEPSAMGATRTRSRTPACRRPGRRTVRSRAEGWSEARERCTIFAISGVLIAPRRTTRRASSAGWAHTTVSVASIQTAGVLRAARTRARSMGRALAADVRLSSRGARSLDRRDRRIDRGLGRGMSSRGSAGGGGRGHAEEAPPTGRLIRARASGLGRHVSQDRAAPDSHIPVRQRGEPNSCPRRGLFTVRSPLGHVRAVQCTACGSRLLPGGHHARSVPRPARRDQ